jgi:hypothetical protein
MTATTLSILSARHSAFSMATERSLRVRRTRALHMHPPGIARLGISPLLLASRFECRTVLNQPNAPTQQHAHTHSQDTMEP